MITRVLIQKMPDTGEFANPSWHAAWHGFRHRGFDTEFFTWPEMRDGLITMNRETCAVGGVSVVRAALEQLGIEMPCFDYPTCLRPFLGREIRRTTMGDVRARYNDTGPTIFIKPARPQDQKLFTGYTVSRFRDLLRTSRLDRDLELYESDPVEFVSEFRFYVHHHKVVAMGHYTGNPTLYPDRETVLRAVGTFADEGAPCSYGIDFGRTPDGRTLLVEVNGGLALGSYGMLPLAFSLFIEDRWDELLNQV